MNKPTAIQHAFERELTIRFSHCDPAGIVFFPRYLAMFNDLVETWVSEGLGIPYAELIATRRIGLPTVNLQCTFSAVSRMGEAVMLGVSVDRIGRSSVQLKLGCRRGDEARVAIEQTLVATDLSTHRAIALPDDLRAAMLGFTPAAMTAAEVSAVVPDVPR